MVTTAPNPAYDPNNVFARILRGEIPCHKVYENDAALAFHDITPAAPVHVLVIPRGAYTDFHDFTRRATPEEIAKFWQAVDHVAQQENLLPAGFRLITNTGPDSGQEVPHFHVHLLGGEKLGPLLSRKG
ncbi:histidine triad nucleotide-binding protein [Oecophyllibacter saccharovorans]|uniref:histidine triad nucleotide-binding protein n=1 Tax=Oecophyllibacter saccharovorans TaxID=2558360 RepID=UPI001144EC59|nr:histidine triad nucleotide-binding protein [Oecophyllibacter saccharovorans]QDH14890.1 histidine triad nucleotide-binding protein [Oecophyllibacter saccharovorans]